MKKPDKRLYKQVVAEFAGLPWFEALDGTEKQFVIDAEAERLQPITDFSDGINALVIAEAGLTEKWKIEKAQLFPYLPPESNNQAVKRAKQNFISRNFLETLP